MKRLKTYTMKMSLYFFILGCSCVFLNGCTYHLVREYTAEDFSKRKWEKLNSKRQYVKGRHVKGFRLKYATDNRVSVEKEFIIRRGSEWWEATQFRFHKDSISFSARKILASEISDIETAEDRKSRRVKKGEKEIFHRVKMFISSKRVIDEGNNRINLTDIERIAIYKRSTGREAIIYVGAISGGMAAIIAVALGSMGGMGMAFTM